MAYHLKSDEMPAAGLRRMAREQILGSLRKLAAASEAEAAAVIHATRKHIKRIRALLHLAHDELGKELFKEENGRLRQVAQSFAGWRDAGVRVHTLEQLREAVGNGCEDFARTRSILEQQSETFGGAFGSEKRRAETTLVEICDRIEGWPLDGIEIDDLCCALRNTYRRGRKCLRYALSDPTPEDFHSLRKRVKELWYQSRILQQLNRLVLCELVNEAKTLARHLGALHDMSSFRAWLEGTPDLPDEERAILSGLICTREREMEKIALDLGTRFFAEKPGVFERRLLRYAREWSTQLASA